jgi:hypothetical protein
LEAVQYRRSNVSLRLLARLGANDARRILKTAARSSGGTVSRKRDEQPKRTGKLHRGRRGPSHDTLLKALGASRWNEALSGRDLCALDVLRVRSAHSSGPPSAPTTFRECGVSDPLISTQRAARSESRQGIEAPTATVNHGHMSHRSMFRATTGPSGGMSRYWRYLSARR